MILWAPISATVNKNTHQLRSKDESLALKGRRSKESIGGGMGRIFPMWGFPKFAGWNDRARREREHEDDFEDAELGDERIAVSLITGQTFLKGVILAYFGFATLPQALILCHCPVLSFRPVQERQEKGGDSGTMGKLPGKAQALTLRAPRNARLDRGPNAGAKHGKLAVVWHGSLTFSQHFGHLWLVI